jgi:hypothetical protein
LNEEEWQIIAEKEVILETETENIVQPQQVFAMTTSLILRNGIAN